MLLPKPPSRFLAIAALLPALALFCRQPAQRSWLHSGRSDAFTAVVLNITVAILYCLKARRVPGLYGWRAPTGFAWLITFPAALMGAVIGGVWTPGSLAYRMGPDNVLEFTGLFALILPLGSELLFRGVILGHLAARLPIQKSAGLWWRSWPTLISTALYAGASVILFLGVSRSQIQLSQCFLIVVGAVIFGIASGIARERSESVLASVLLHWVCVAALLLSSRLLF
jgi:membrane protease YdiL (CAAX protease family)